MTTKEYKELQINTRVEYDYLDKDLNVQTKYGTVMRRYDNYQILIKFDGEPNPRILGYTNVDIFKETVQPTHNKYNLKITAGSLGDMETEHWTAEDWVQHKEYIEKLTAEGILGKEHNATISVEPLPLLDDIESSTESISSYEFTTLDCVDSTEVVRDTLKSLFGRSRIWPNEVHRITEFINKCSVDQFIQIKNQLSNNG